MKFRVVLLILLLVSFFGCDITNKTEVEESMINMQVVRPISWEEFDNNELQVNLLVESEQDINSLDLFVDGNLVQTMIDEPYQTTIQVADIGTHNFYAIATDALGTTHASELVNFSIKTPDTESPYGFIAYPADWSDVSGTFDVMISAIDNVEVSNVELFLDATLYENRDSSPYTFSIDSTILTNDNHTIYAKIYDTNNNQSTTQLITVKVAN